MIADKNHPDRFAIIVWNDTEIIEFFPDPTVHAAGLGTRVKLRCLFVDTNSTKGTRLRDIRIDRMPFHSYILPACVYI